MGNQRRCISTKTNRYPNHLTHGLLAKHCASETDYESGNPKIKPGDKVLVSLENSEHLSFNEFHGEAFDFNEHLKEWEILEVIDQAQTGYLGIIYVNEHKKQLVLAHRSTNFLLSLTGNLLKQSGMQQDIEGVLMGNILLHQAHGHFATGKAVNLIKTTHKDYTLTFTGHSLGAWLASLSVFYCHDDFHYEHARAITFDGPGAYEMMERMRSGDIKGISTIHKIKLEHLDIISYLSAPNIVNCTNKHVGTVYRLFPSNIKDTIKKQVTQRGGRELNKFLTEDIVDQIPRPMLVNCGHDLEYILPHFDPTAGKPKVCKLIEKWPSIIYSDFGNNSSNFSIWKSVVNVGTGLVLPQGMQIVATGVKIIIGAVQRVFNCENTTLDSVAHLAVVYSKGKIDLHQYWLVHEHFDKDCRFQVDVKNSVDKFFLQFKAQYKESDAVPWKSKKTGTKTDKFLKILQTQTKKIQGRLLVDLAKKYKYSVTDNYFTIKEEYRNSFTMDDIRDKIGELWRSDSYFEQYFNNIGKARLSENIEEESPELAVETDEIAEMCGNHKVVVIKGMPGIGKTSLAKAYARDFKDEFTTILLSASSFSVLKKSLEDCIPNSLKGSSNKDPNIDVLIELLSETKQPVLFILDNVKDYADILKFVEGFSNLTNVKLIITTQHNKLGINVPEISLEYTSDDAARAKLRKKVQETLTNCLAVNEQTINNTVERPTCNLVKFLSFIKSGTISKQQLVNSLSYCYPPEETRLAIDKLLSLSLITIDNAQYISTSMIVQELAMELSDYQSAANFLQIVSLFKSRNILIVPILSKLLTYELVQKVEEVKQLLSSLEVQYKYNMASTLTLLLKEAQTSLQSEQREQIINTLKYLKHFMTEIDTELQSLLTFLTNSWSEAHKQGVEKAFLVKNGSLIKNFLKTFSLCKLHAQQCFSCDQVAQGTEHVLVIGPTGSGKSTVIDHLIEKALECVRVGRNGAETVIKLMQAEDNCLLGTGNSTVAEIGNNPISSQTDSITPYYNINKGITYWDFPGFFDSRGEMKKMHHAFLMQSFSKVVPKFKILLVIEVAIISAMKGEGFINLLNSLSQLCSADQIHDSLSLLITKCDPFEQNSVDTQNQLDEEQTYYVKEKFSKFLEKHKASKCTSILELLTRDNMKKKIAFFFKVKKGPITKDFFQGLDSAVEASQPANIDFHLSLDATTMKEITTLSHLLNSYAQHITQERADTQIAEVKQKIQQDGFQKKDLFKIKKFSVPNINERQYIEGFRHETIFNNIMATLKFFHVLNPACKPNLESWIQPFTKFYTEYDKLVQENTGDTKTAGIMLFKAPILTASEVKKAYGSPRPEITAVKVYSYLFIVDQDLELPGINLAIASHEWRVIGDRKISLKGDCTERIIDGKCVKIIDSGSFYGYAGQIKGGKIMFDLDGVDGEEGKFDLSHKDKEIEKIEEELKILDAQINAVTHLKSLYTLGLEKQINKLTEKEKLCRKAIKDIEVKIADLENKLSNPLSETKREENATNVQQERIKKKKKAEDLQEILKELTTVKKLQELVNIHSDYQQLCKEYVPLTEAIIDEDAKHRLSEEVIKVRKKIDNVTEMLTQVLQVQEEQNLNKYQDLQSFSQKVKAIVLGFESVALQRDKEYSVWLEQRKKVEVELLCKHFIAVNDVQLEYNAQDINNLFEHDSIKNDLEIRSKALIELKETYKKQVTELQQDVVDFIKHHETRQHYKAQKKQKRGELRQHQQYLEETLSAKIEAKELNEKINELTAATYRKNLASRELNIIKGKKDSTVSNTSVLNEKVGVKEISASKLTHKLLRSVNNDEFTKQSAEQKSKLEEELSQLQETKDRTKEIAQKIEQYAEVKVKIEIFEVKKLVNMLVNRYHLAEECKYQLEDNDKDKLEQEFKDSKVKLMLLWEEDHWFGSLRSITDDKLETYSNELATVVQETYKKLANLENRLEYARVYTESLSEAVKKYQEAEKQFQIAKKDYQQWVKNHPDTLSDTIKVYNEYIKCDAQVKEAFNEEAKSAERLLRKEVNLLERIERKWDNRNLFSKCAYVAKEILLFNRQFYETYKLSGSEGSIGGDSGAYRFKYNSEDSETSHTVIHTQKPGQGGKHSAILEGTYISEYCFPFFRGIKEKAKIKESFDIHGVAAMAFKSGFINTIAFVASFTDDIAQFAFKGFITKATTGLALGALTIGGQCLLSPAIANLSSHWVDGPYKTKSKPAKDGKEGKIDEELSKKNITDYFHYVQEEISEELKSFFPNITNKKLLDANETHDEYVLV
ncbi:uncharacterized protein LOC105843848 [Hydra vulgaris]|uniref:uncharacterized protein LOC105843848 n=1 Tax=Hydra vulgaris TaxID=6087 RepID=UPI001F5FDBCC|nr:uncharacterized protein LOC105843848 [Hydra vulgaris]